MKLRVKSNGLEVEMKNEIWDKMDQDQQMSYEVISTDEPVEKKDQAVKNEVPAPKKDKAPDSGDKK